MTEEADETSPSGDAASRDDEASPTSLLLAAAGKLGAVRRLAALRVHERFAAGGMACVHFGWLEHGQRLVAVKKPHKHLLHDETFARMLLDEARLAMQVEDPNVVSVLGVVRQEDELMLVMDYVQGASLAEILGALRPRGLESSVAATVVAAGLDGLHAAHEARGAAGAPLGIVHRDVSPQNLLVGEDGLTRVVDFGVAKAKERLQTTLHAIVKGKLAYAAPEHLFERRVDARSDVYSASVVLWEALTGRPLFHASTVNETLQRILHGPVEPPSAFAPTVPAALDAVVLRGLSRDPHGRFATAREMARALERAVPMTPADRVAARLSALGIAACAERSRGADAVRRRERRGVSRAGARG